MIFILHFHRLLSIYCAGVGACGGKAFLVHGLAQLQYHGLGGTGAIGREQGIKTGGGRNVQVRFWPEIVESDS